MVEFARKGMIEIHRLRLAPNMFGTDIAKCLVVKRTDLPQRSLLGTIGLQTLTEDKQGIVALSKRVPQIGAGACTVIAIMHFTVTEMNHEVVLVDHFQFEGLGGCCRYGRHQNGKQNDRLKHLLDHINHQLLVSFVANKLGKVTDFSRESQTFCPLFVL